MEKLKGFLPAHLRGGRGLGSIARGTGLLGAGAMVGDALLSNQLPNPDSAVGQIYSDLFSSSSLPTPTTVRLK